MRQRCPNFFCSRLISRSKPQVSPKQTHAQNFKNSEKHQCFIWCSLLLCKKIKPTQGKPKPKCKTKTKCETCVIWTSLLFQSQANPKHTQTNVIKQSENDIIDQQFTNEERDAAELSTFLSFHIDIWGPPGQPEANTK